MAASGLAACLCNLPAIAGQTGAHGEHAAAVWALEQDPGIPGAFYTAGVHHACMASCMWAFWANAPLGQSVSG